MTDLEHTQAQPEQADAVGGAPANGTDGPLMRPAAEQTETSGESIAPHALPEDEAGQGATSSLEGDAAQDSLRKEAAPATDNRGDGQPHDTPKSTDGLVLGMAIGMVAGILIGFVLHQMPIWIVVGILLGGFIGFLLDSRNDRRRKESVAGEKDTER